MGDYLPSIPGVSAQDRGATQNSIVIRGIAADPQFESATVGVYFGEIPLTGVGSTGGTGNPDLKLVDIERVEVLRGPQGTLYGDGSMGGAVRVIPKKPDLVDVGGELSTTYSETSGQGGENYSVRGVLSVPVVEDVLALRGVAYRYDNSGYIESGDAAMLPSLAGPLSFGAVGSTRDDIGSDEYTGFRLSGLWRPLDDLDITLTYADQEIEQDGRPEVNLESTEKFESFRIMGGFGQDEEVLENDLKATNLEINYDLGWGSLMSSSSWVDYQTNIGLDISHIFYYPFFNTIETDIELFVEEIRFVSAFDGPLQVLAGVYYADRDEDSDIQVLWSGDPELEASAAAVLPFPPPFDTFPSSNPVTGMPYNTITSQNLADVSLEQTAVFGELSYDVTEQLTLTFGARYFDYEKRSITDASGYFYGLEFDDIKSSEDGTSLKANVSYQADEQTLVYGQWAEGFRLGGPQALFPDACDVDEDGIIDGIGVENGKPVESDELDSYELGVKTKIFSGRVAVNASVYHIDWEGMPVFVVAPCGFSPQVNTGKSESEGIELEVTAQLSDSLAVDFGASYNEAKLTEDVPDVTGFGVNGDDLPGSADYNISLGLEYQFVINGLDSFVRGDYSYVSTFYDNFEETGEASGGYGLINLKAGVAFSQIDVDLFVNNLTDADDFTWVESLYGDLGSQRAYRLRPRTIGLNIGYRF